MGMSRIPRASQAHPIGADVVLIGGGIMSATLGSMLSILAPEWRIVLLERSDALATESSGPWNNAGTGHTGFCELNYMPDPETAPRPPRSLANFTSAGSGGRIWRTTHCYAPTPSFTLPRIWTWSSGIAMRTTFDNATKPWPRIRCSAECGSAMTPPPSNGGRPW